MRLSGGNFPRWKLSGGNYLGAIALGEHCPGGIIQGAIVLGGNCLGHLSRGNDPVPI